MQHLLWMKHSWSFVGSIVTIMAAKLSKYFSKEICSSILSD